MKLTERLVGSLKPRATDQLTWDDTLPGFGLRVKPSGAKSYLIQYRNAGRVSRRYTLGSAATLRLEEARRRARKLLVAVKDGADPAADRVNAREAVTVAELCERYMAEHAEPHKKPSSRAEDRRLIDKRIVPALGKLKAAAVARADVLKLHHSLRDTRYEANRALALLSKMMNLAEAWGVRTVGANPCKHVKRFQERKRERFLSEAELARLGAALAQAETAATEPAAAINAIRLLALTGCRLSEILTLRWEHVDLPGSHLMLPDAKAGARSVPLGAAAKRLLAALARGGEYVFPAPNAPDQPVAVRLTESVWARLRKAAGIADARLHDLRHTAGTYAGHSGANAFLVRDLLGHRTLAMTARYVQQDANPLLALADRVSDRIAAAMSCGAAEVLPLAKATRQ